MTPIKFNTGLIVKAKLVADRLETDGLFSYFCADALAQYIRGDWGNASDEEAAMNNKALLTKNGDRTVANYIYPRDNTKIQIITDFGDNPITTLLFPKEC